VVNLVFCEVETTILIKKREFGEKNVYMWHHFWIMSFCWNVVVSSHKLVSQPFQAPPLMRSGVYFLVAHGKPFVYTDAFTKTASIKHLQI